MSELPKRILGFLGVIFALLVLGFTGFQTWSLLYEVSGNAVTAVIGLALFEGGMLYWWFAFQKEAEGIGQMALSLMMAIFGLLLVGGATALHLGAVGAEALGPHTPARLVTLAAVINLIGKFMFPLLAPAIFEDIWMRALEGKISNRAYKDADSQVDDLAAQLGIEIGGELTRKVKVRMLTHYGLTHDQARLPSANPTVIDGTAVAVEEPEDKGMIAGLRRFLRGSQEPAQPLGNVTTYPIDEPSTHAMAATGPNIDNAALEDLATPRANFTEAGAA